MTREELIETIVEATLMDKLYVPKNEKERKKLAKRGTAAHIAHGTARFAAGAPFLLGGGVWNALRYAQKVDIAKKGYHREQKYFREDVIEAILEAEKTTRINLLRGPGSSSANSLVNTLSRRIHNRNTPNKPRPMDPRRAAMFGYTDDPKVMNARAKSQLVRKALKALKGSR